MGDVVAPAYTETDESELHSFVEQVVARAKELGLPLTRLQEPIGQKDIGKVTNGTALVGSPQERAATKQIIVANFFRLVRAGQTELVALFVHSGLVSPDVLEWGAEDIHVEYWASFHPCEPDDPGSGATPLLAAVSAGSASMVRMLVSLGADVNLLARPPRRKGNRAPELGHNSYRDYRVIEERRRRRTPLMLAAADGRLALVRLLLTELHADDAIVAPDGQLALRLAANAGHRDIVALLPARRGGVRLRLRASNTRAMHRAARAARGICTFTAETCKIVGWKLPRFFLWTVPRAVVDILAHGITYAWKHRRGALAALMKLPQQLWKIVSGLGRGAVTLTKCLAQAIADVISRIPAALRLTAAWVAQSASRIGHALSNAMLRVVSALHTAATAFAATIANLPNVTLQDVWSDLSAAVRAIFLEFPLALVAAAHSLGTYVLEIMEKLFGFFGTILVILATAVFKVITFIPKRLWRILCAMGSSLSSCFVEVRVWVNPKYSA